MSRSTNEWAGQSVSQGRYLVRAQLGEGGMGFVYRAVDRNLDSDVVIKVPRRAMLDDPEFASRFAREVRSLVKLSHPNIVKVTDVGEHDGMPFAVMQYLSGGSLEDYAGAGRGDAAVASTTAALPDWLPGVAAALDFVHSQGYVHRDVKPGNILFDAHGHVFLSDFGVAKALAAEADSAPTRRQTAMTGAGMVLGTPEYMAPELIMGQAFDGRIDQYALAVTVYEMLAGRRPFESSSPTACMVMQTTQVPPPLCRVEPRVSRALSDAVARALDKVPSHRYPNCAAFASAVVSAAAGAAVVGAAAHKTPSGHALRPDQARLECPSCAKSLIFPAALLADPEKVRGKRATCPSCQAALRIADDGRSLVVASGASSSGLLASPSTTRKVVAPRSSTIPVARPAPAQTIRQAPPPLPPAIPPPPDVPAAPVAAKAVPHRAIAVGVGGTVLAVLVAAVVAIGTARSGPKLGRIRVDTTSVPHGAAYSLDGQPVVGALFGDPLTLAPGKHELDVTREGYEPFSRQFSVAAGEESGFKVFLTREPPPPAPTPPAPAVKVPDAPVAGRPDVPPPPVPVASVTVPAPEPKNLYQPVQASRVEPAPSRYADFKPVPDGPPVDREPLGSLLQKPSAFADRIFVPTGLYVLGPLNPTRRGGLAAITVTRTTLHVRGNNLASLMPADQPAEVSVNPELADHLRPLAPHWGNTASVLTFHVQRRGDGESAEFVPTLKKVEFLDAMNFFRIGEGNFKDSFRTITVTSATPPTRSLSDRHDWRTRLGVPYCSQLKRFAMNLTSAKFASEMQFINKAMAPALNNAIRSNVTPADILDARARMGR